MAGEVIFGAGCSSGMPRRDGGVSGSGAFARRGGGGSAAIGSGFAAGTGAGGTGRRPVSTLAGRGGAASDLAGCGAGCAVLDGGTTGDVAGLVSGRAATWVRVSAESVSRTSAGFGGRLTGGGVSGRVGFASTMMEVSAGVSMSHTLTT